MRIKLLFPLFLILTSLFVIFLWWKTVSAPVSSEAKFQDFLITRGQSAQQIGERLEEAGLIKSALAFKFYVQISGKEKEILAGDYRLAANSSLTQVIGALVLGPQELWLTFPEGFRREEIAARTINTLGLSGEGAETFWQEFLSETKSEEGFLFPDTYLFARDVTAATVAKKLRSTFDKKVEEKLVTDAEKSGLTLTETLTLASIVERETKTEEERPIVAGILIKRWNAGWALQADATLQYAVATANCPLSTIQLDCKWWNIPTTDQRKLRSAYNTYTNAGLPPAPIANPGLSSIRAVIYPQDSDFWFYLHDPEGKVHFARTIEEHNENINRHLR